MLVLVSDERVQQSLSLMNREDCGEHRPKIFDQSRKNILKQKAELVWAMNKFSSIAVVSGHQKIVS